MEQVTQIKVELSQPAVRLDAYLCTQLPQVSRGAVQRMLEEGSILVDGKPSKTTHHPRAGEVIDIRWPTARPTQLQPEDIELEVLFEDADLLVINKRADMVVHPAAGNRDGTLLNALLHYAPELASVPRAGLVHRIDKDTTGLLVVARTLVAHKLLVEQLQARLFEREYEAVVAGVMTGGSTVEGAMARHPRDRVRMAVTATGKPAITHYRVLQRFRAHTHVQVKLETGRTHQIRVHMAHIHHPVIGDPVYGGRARIPAGCSPALAEALRHFKRQALHAARLGLEHPLSGEHMAWAAPLPADMQTLLAVLREDIPA